jgi:hypothetical protein
MSAHPAQWLGKFQTLPPEKQAEVIDFIEYLASRCPVAPAHGLDEWTEAEFAELSMQSALRGLEDEPDIYTLEDLKERWL